MVSTTSYGVPIILLVPTVYHSALSAIRYCAPIVLLAILYSVQINLTDYRNFLYCKGKFYPQLRILFELLISSISYSLLISFLINFL